MLSFLRNILTHRRILFAMARRELSTKYVGTLLGPLWGLIQPLATLLVYWFVFSVGLRAQGPRGTSFVIYFLAGYIPWQLFADATTASVNCVTANSFLVKKVVFPTEILPLVHFLVGLVTHLLLLFVFVCLLVFEGRTLYPEALYLIPYYLCALIILYLGVGWLFASLQVFSRDLGQMMAVLLNLWFWLTPIVWSREIIPGRYQWFVDVNPMAFVVEGYRSALVFHDTSPGGLSPAVGEFWLIAIALFLLGGSVFRRLKPEFPDVL